MLTSARICIEVFLSTINVYSFVQGFMSITCIITFWQIMFKIVKIGKIDDVITRLADVS